MPDDTHDDTTVTAGSGPEPKDDSATRATIEQLDEDLADRLEVDPAGDVKG